MFVLVTGNPLDGLRLWGPFDGPAGAIAAADAHASGADWWAAEVEAPMFEEEW